MSQDLCDGRQVVSDARRWTTARCDTMRRDMASIILVFGFPGSGKSTLSKALHERHGLPPEDLGRFRGSLTAVREALKGEKYVSTRVTNDVEAFLLEPRVSQMGQEKLTNR
jgi:hypothetical protein